MGICWSHGGTPLASGSILIVTRVGRMSGDIEQHDVQRHHRLRYVPSVFSQ